jgi:hypothetical protein
MLFLLVEFDKNDNLVIPIHFRPQPKGAHGLHQDSDLSAGARVHRLQLPHQTEEVRDRRRLGPHRAAGRERKKERKKEEKCMHVRQGLKNLWSVFYGFQTDV